MKADVSKMSDGELVAIGKEAKKTSAAALKLLARVVRELERRAAASATASA